jgi:hypothetical protein
MLPRVLNKHLKSLELLTNREIAEIAIEVVENGMTRDMLIGGVSARVLQDEDINDMNDCSYNFKKAVMIRVAKVVDKLNFKYETTKSMMIDKEGTMYPVTHKTIVEEREPREDTKIWFNDPTRYQDYITLKGSNKRIDNNSTDVLELKTKIKLKVKEIDERYIDLYAVLLFEANKSKVNEDPEYYLERLQNVAEETKLFMGQEYTNYRKLDSNSRNYPLNRYGFAYEYGDAFGKNLIGLVQEYKVDVNEIDGAIEYLADEFDTDNVDELYTNSIDILNHNLSELKKYNKGLISNFNISEKELGEHLHIVEVYENIICNNRGMTSTVVGYDFTNSGGINAANQFGDKKFKT